MNPIGCEIPIESCLDEEENGQNQIYLIAQ